MLRSGTLKSRSLLWVTMRYRMLLLSSWNNCWRGFQSDCVYVPCLYIWVSGIKLVWIFLEFILSDSIILPIIVILPFWNMAMRRYVMNLLRNTSSRLDSKAVCSKKVIHMLLKPRSKYEPSPVWTPQII